MPRTGGLREPIRTTTSRGTMHQFSYLLRQMWFRIGVALWLGLLAAGIVGVLRWNILEGLLAGIGGESLAGAVGRPILALIAGVLCFVIAGMAMQAMYRSLARPSYESRVADEPFAETPAVPEPVESLQEPEGIEAEEISEPVEARTDEADLPNDAPVEPASAPLEQHSEPADQPFTFGEDDGIELRLDSIPAKLGPMRQAWLMETGETLGTPRPLAEPEEDIAYGSPVDDEAESALESREDKEESGFDLNTAIPTSPEHDRSERPLNEADNLNPERFVPSLTELEKRLANAITRLDQVSPDRANEERREDQTDEAPLLDEEARKAVERALAKLENYTHRK